MKPVIVPRPEHSISRKLIDEDALRVMYRLLKAGHHAYLVGGGVRDLLLGRTPKDFDIGTDAHPNQMKKLFRNCRLVGRRFRLAHVHFGDKIIEVSTFRRRAEFEEQNGGDLLIRSDNTFGTPEEDALRRDFTINGLFYDLETFSVIDYVGGIEDLHRRTIRSIGDPDERIQEDPVRILRAVKFAARLGFDIDPPLWAAMVRNAADIHKCAKARVLEEIYRLLRGGTAAASFQLLADCRLLRELLPEVTEFLDDSRSERDADRRFWQYLNATDELRRDGREISNSLLLGALAVHLVGCEVGVDREREPDPPELGGMIDELTAEWVDRLGVARRDRERLAQMLRSQPRFTRTGGRRFRPRSFVAKHYFPDALQLFALGCQATGLELDALARWQELNEQMRGEERRDGAGDGTKAASGDHRGAGGDAARDNAAPLPRSRRRRRRKDPGEAITAIAVDASPAKVDSEEDGQGRRHRSRRRRRRRR
jgi:poly(A) polymerase